MRAVDLISIICAIQWQIGHRNFVEASRLSIVLGLSMVSGDEFHKLLLAEQAKQESRFSEALETLK